MLQDISHGNGESLQENYISFISFIHYKVLEDVPACALRDKMNLSRVADITFFLVKNILYLCGTSHSRNETDKIVFSKVQDFEVLGDVVKGTELSYIEGNFPPMFKYVQSYGNSATLYGYEDDSVYFCYFDYGTGTTFIKFICNLSSPQVPRECLSRQHASMYCGAGEPPSKYGKDHLKTLSDAELEESRRNCLMFNPHFRFDMISRMDIESVKMIETLMVPVGISHIPADISKMSQINRVTSGNLCIFFPTLCDHAFEFPVESSLPEDWFKEESMDVVACGSRKLPGMYIGTGESNFAELIKIHIRIVDKLYDVYIHRRIFRGDPNRPVVETSLKIIPNEGECKCLQLFDYVIAEDGNLHRRCLKQKHLCGQTASKYLNLVSPAHRLLHIGSDGVPICVENITHNKSAMSAM